VLYCGQALLLTWISHAEAVEYRGVTVYKPCK
jgi:hypothetical protein